MTNSISDLGQRQMNLNTLSLLRERVNTTQQQISTGKKSDLYSGLNNQAGNAISLRNSVVRLETYRQNIAEVRVRTKAMDEGLSNVAKLAREVSNNLIEQIPNANMPIHILREEARLKLQAIQQTLNESIDGRRLFSGDAITTDPYANAATLATNVNAEISSANPANTVLTNISGFTPAQLGYAGALATAGAVTVRVDDNRDIDYTVRADDPALRDIMRGLAIIASPNLDPAAMSEQRFIDIFNGARALIDNGTRGVDRLQGALGNVSNLMESASKNHGETEVNLEKFLSDIEDVDVAEAITKMQMLQTQMQASYQTIANLRQLSLLNFL